MGIKMNISVVWFTLLLSFCSGQLTSQSVSEGPCMADIENYLVDYFNKTWYFSSREYYIPMASTFVYRIAAESFLGRSAKSKNELTNMKFRIKIIPGLAGPKFKLRGFKPERHFYESNCRANNTQWSQIYCGPNKKCSRRADPSNLPQVSCSAVYTDNKSFVLMVLCFNKKYRAYSVHSVQPTLQSYTQDIIKEKIEELGFDTNLIGYQIY